jgi:hypothetical protein
MDKIALICSVLLGVSEALSLIPSVKANGVIQLVINLLKSVAGK